MKSTATLVMTGVFACGLAVTFAQERALTSVWDLVYSSEQAARGKALYGHQQCKECHGEDLRTPGGAAAGPPLAGEVFMTRWRGRTVDALAQYVQENMPLGQGGLLTRKESIDLVAHILDTNGFGAGPAELRPDAAGLSAIVIKDKTDK